MQTHNSNTQRANMWSRLRRTSCVALSLAAFAACAPLADLLTPGQRGTTEPAAVALQANIPRFNTSATDVVTLNVIASYVRKDGSRVRIGAQTLSLTNSELQSVPIPVDVGTCLADPQRDGGTGSCVVVLNLALLVNGVIVDEQVVGPLSLTPGQATEVSEPVTLFSIAALEIVDANGALVSTTSPLVVNLGDTPRLYARVLDGDGKVVNDRIAAWRSDAPAVATISGSGNVTTLAVGSARFTAELGTLSATVTANVVRPPAALEVVGAAGSGRGTVRSTPAGINCRVEETATTGTCRFTFPGDANIELRSIPDDGNLFAAWGEECSVSSRESTCTVRMSSARRASARFTALRRITIATSATSDGSGRVTGSAGLDCVIRAGAASGNCSVQVEQGTAVTLTATAEPRDDGTPTRQLFAGWGGDCGAANGAACAFTAGTTNTNATVTFFNERRLTVSTTGDGGGLVRAGSLVQCARAVGATSGACEAPLTHGSRVTLSAIADSRSEFKGWTGACTAREADCTVTMTEARSVTATFARPTATLVITGIAGSGRGTIRSQPAGIDCVVVGATTSGACAFTFADRVTVTLLATADANNDFVGWGGECAASANAASCDIPLTTARSVSAGFAALRQITVRAATQSDGRGRVTSPGGLDCSVNGTTSSGTCTVQARAGETVTLTAVPEAGVPSLQTFGAWGGDCASSTGSTCTLTVDGANRAVTALFQGERRLRVNVVGTGGGSVVSGTVVQCTRFNGNTSGSCDVPYAHNSVVSLVATADAQSLFGGWTGGVCSSNTNMCSVTMSQARSVTATFVQRAADPAIQVGPVAGSTGSGVLSTPSFSNGLNCAYALGSTSGACVMTVPAGTNVNITATSGPASALIAWGDACAGTMSLTCAVRPTNATTVSARFAAAIDVNMVISGTGTGAVTFAIPSVPAQAACTSAAGQASTCRYALPIGSSGVFRATAAAGSSFVGFSGACQEGVGPVPVCTYQGFGFVREVRAVFSTP